MSASTSTRSRTKTNTSTVLILSGVADVAGQQEDQGQSSQDRLLSGAGFRIHSPHDSGPVRDRCLRGLSHQGRS